MSQANVKEALLATIEGLKANPSASNVVFRAETRWVEDVLCSASIRDFPAFAVDEPPELGGKDSAANPVELVLAALGTVAGAALLATISLDQFQLMIGLLVICASLALTFYRPKEQRKRPLLGNFTGLVSGLMNGAFAIPGPAVIIYAVATESEPARSRALLMTFFLFSAAIALASFGKARCAGGACQKLHAKARFKIIEAATNGRFHHT